MCHKGRAPRFARARPFIVTVSVRVTHGKQMKLVFLADRAKRAQTCPACSAPPVRGDGSPFRDLSQSDIEQYRVKFGKILQNMSRIYILLLIVKQMYVF